MVDHVHVPWKNSVRNYRNSHGRNSSAVSLTRFRSLCMDYSYGIISHSMLSYASVVYSIRRYHVQCFCYEAAWAAHAVLSSTAALLQRHFFTWHLSSARYTYLATRQHFSATAKQRSTGFLKQGKYTGFLIWPFSTSFLNCGYSLGISIGCYASSLISLAFSFQSSCSTYGSSQLLTIVAESPSLDQLISVDD